MERTLRSTTRPHASAAPARASARYIGIDLARLLAVIGMMANHLVAIVGANPAASELDQRASEIATTMTGGIAAALFAVLGGVSAVFASRRAIAAGRQGAAIASIMVRGVILIVLGLALGALLSPIIVVLAYYGVAMILVAVFVAARSWVIALTAAALWVAGGPLNALARQALGVVEEAGSPSFESIAAEPLETIRGLLLTGTYPAVTWVAYLLVGMLIARALLSAQAAGRLGRTALALGGAGVALATFATLVSNWVLANLDRFGVTAPPGLDMTTFSEYLGMQQFGAPSSPELWAQLIASPHSGSPIEMLRTVGISLAVIGLLVTLFDSRGSAPGRVTDVFRAAGAAPLTIYTLHLIATSIAYAPLYAGSDFGGALPWWVAGLGALGIQLAGVLVIGLVLSLTGRRGPLEALTSRIARLVTRS
ncbi:heparan-alpha-glucosaminide N-acetyltransferase domain-containing protein [Leucobacter albus]|uniref:Heparan-alpha-glucosaminide N-acetyltransferase domain-containing protein n=1 Tax=Leucobacter albus TaxID=272210 RepID=A0ABW3TQX5_9MICO